MRISIPENDRTGLSENSQICPGLVIRKFASAAVCSTIERSPRLLSQQTKSGLPGRERQKLPPLVDRFLTKSRSQTLKSGIGICRATIS